MHKHKKIMKMTDSNVEFNKCYRRYLENKTGKCSRCRPHKGCNGRETYDSWKKYRKTQYKV